MRKNLYIFAGILVFLYTLINVVGDVRAASCETEAVEYLIKAQDAQNSDDKIAYYQKAMEIDPNCSNAHINLSVLYMNANRFDEAIDILQKAYGIEPENQLVKQNLLAAYINLGYGYSQSGKEQDAIPFYEKALTVDPQNGIAISNLSAAYTNLGVQFYKQGEARKAWEAFCKALEVSSDNQVAKSNLQNLFDEDCPATFSENPTSAPIADKERIREMVLQAIAKWQTQHGHQVTEREKGRIAGAYIASVEECATDFGSLQRTDIETHVFFYLDYKDENPDFVVCDPLQ